jgi:hypothetical protein
VFTVTGSPALAFADAIALVLASDAILTSLAGGGIFAALPRAGRTGLPYVVLGRRDYDDQGGAMQLAGGLAKLSLEVWSDLNGPGLVHQIQSRTRALLLRQTLPLVGFAMLGAALTCAAEQVTLDPDPDMPERNLFHGTQEWTAWLEEAA